MRSPDCFLHHRHKVGGILSESEERESQKLMSIVAVGASETISRNQLLKSDLLEMKNGEMTPRPLPRPLQVELI